MKDHVGVSGGDVIITTIDAVLKWGRKSSIWPMPFGTACCAIEFMALTASHYAIASARSSGPDSQVS